MIPLVINNLNYKEKELLIADFGVDEVENYADGFTAYLAIDISDLENVGVIIMDHEHGKIDLESLADGILEITLFED